MQKKKKRSSVSVEDWSQEPPRYQSLQKVQFLRVNGVVHARLPRGRSGRESP